MQLDLFVDKDNPIDIRLKIVEDKCEKVKVSSDNVRRGLFARHNELAKMYVEMKEKYEKLEKEIEELRHGNDHRKTVYLYGSGADGDLFKPVREPEIDRNAIAG